MPSPQTSVLAILVGAFLLLASGWLRPDVVAIAVLLALVLTGATDPSAIFDGFASHAVVTIAALMIIGEGLVRTGVVRWVARRLEGLIGQSRHKLVLTTTAAPGLLSGFINIVAAASFFIPVILRLSKALKTSPSRVLLPMACASLVGANLSLMGASHNLVVHDLLRSHDGQGLSFFETAPLGLALLLATIAYTFTLGSRLLPDAESQEDDEATNLVEAFALHDRLFEIWVGEPSDGEGLVLASLPFDDDEGLTLLGHVRDQEQLLFPDGDTCLERGDLLLVQGRREAVEAFVQEHSPLVLLGSPRKASSHPISPAQLAEVVVPPRSPVVGKPLSELRLREDDGMIPLAIYRDDTPRRTQLESTELQPGDSILVYGPREPMRRFDPEKALLVYEKPERDGPPADLRRLAPAAVVVVLVVVALAAFGVVPIAVSATGGAALMVVTQMLDPEAIYDAVDGRTLVLVGGILPLGAALERTGAASWLGDGLIALVGDLGPWAVLAAVTAAAMVLTQAMHNAAVAVIVTPIAIEAAQRVDANATAVCVAVVAACSTTFLLPYGHPAVMMVEQPGEYQRADYRRYGAGLQLIAFAVITGLVPLLWPL